MTDFFPNPELLTDAENAALDLLSQAIDAIYSLPRVHDTENLEHDMDFHAIQCRILARAAYDKSVRVPDTTEE